MAASRIPGPNGNSFDSPMPGRRFLSLTGPLGISPEFVSSELDKEKREVILDLSQLILDITGIFEPTPFSDGTNALISLARGKWVDAAISAVSIIPYLGDLSKVLKLPKHLDPIRRAIRIAKKDVRWSNKLRVLFVKLKKVLDNFAKYSADQLPDGAKKNLKIMQQEIDRFLWPQGRAVHKAEVARPQIKRTSQKRQKKTTRPTGKKTAHSELPEKFKIPARADDSNIVDSRNLSVTDVPEHTYRGDSRGPEEILSKGFSARGSSTDLEDYARSNTPSVYVGTSKDPEVAKDFATNFGSNDGYVYTIKPDKGIDLNKELGNKSPFPDEHEVVIPGGIKPENIKGSTPVNKDGSFGTSTTLNPKYYGKTDG